MNYYRNSGKTSTGASWRDNLETIKTAREEYRQYGGMMTPYERSIIERDIKERTERAFPAVSQGIIGEYKGAIKRIQESQQAYDREVTKEITRWDTGKLANELQAVQTLVDLAIAGGGGGVFDGGSPGVGAKLEAVYREALQSGDPVKQRATFEVMKSVLPKVKDSDRLEANRLAKLAERDLSSLRVTEGMVKAREAQGQAWDEFLKARDELISIPQALGEGDPTGPFASNEFAKALRMVSQDRETGEVIIYPEDSVEVSGVDWSSWKEGEK